MDPNKNDLRQTHRKNVFRTIIFAFLSFCRGKNMVNNERLSHTKTFLFYFTLNSSGWTCWAPHIFSRLPHTHTYILVPDSYILPNFGPCSILVEVHLNNTNSVIRVTSSVVGGASVFQKTGPGYTANMANVVFGANNTTDFLSQLVFIIIFFVRTDDDMVNVVRRWLDRESVINSNILARFPNQ